MIRGTGATPLPMPLWWRGEAVPLALPSAAAQESLPTQVDVLVVGGGYTGLAAARETAAAGRSTLVLDAESVGSGCSSRNGGQVAHSIKPTFSTLTKRHGADLAQRIHAEAARAVAHLRCLATEEQLDCDWQPRGCFHGAHTAKHFDALVKKLGDPAPGLTPRISLVPRSEQGREIDTDFYHGGCIYHDDASIDPPRLMRALLARAQAQGARVVDRCAVTALRRTRDGFEVETSRGRVAARRVLLATNGYTGRLSAWHRRRVIPIGSYQIATERLGVERVRALIPQGRNISDTRRVVVYYRPSPDGERIVFGGRASLDERDPLVCVPRLRGMLCQIFPQLTGVAITHAWAGFVAYTFDTLPHLGQDEGLYYSMGYCGQGVPLAPYFGMRIGQQMADLPEGRTALDGLAFPARPYYFGNPWFLAASVFTYRILDSLGV
jgi:glycine/D-amino acid oxidase-like deaminating enzyme